MTDYLDTFDNDGSIVVTAPSGATFYVLTEAERDYFEDVAARYQADNQFSNITDIQDLDRVLMMELLCFRWNSWLINEIDYDGLNVVASDVGKQIKDLAGEIRLLKKSLGIDKAARDKERGESVQQYIENLKVRAKKFGYMRNEQASKSIELFMDLQALMTMHNNCTQEERKENSVDIPDIIEWIEEYAIPEFNEIDAKFRQTEQQYWIRNM